MQECKHKIKFYARFVCCCAEGNVLSNNIDKFYQIEPNLIPSESPILLLKEYELAEYFIK